MATPDQQLKQIIGETLSPYAETRKTAEGRLSQAQKTQGHLLEVLKLVAASEATAGNTPQQQEAAIRQAAAVHFKNTIKKGWDVHREDGNDGIVITDNERQTIKSHLVQLMCTTPPQIQAMLSECISLIAIVDYPNQWDNLLPELVQQFHSSTDPTVVIGVLKTANSIFKRFRYVERSDELYRIILYTLHKIQEPLLSLFLSTGQAVQALSTTNDKNNKPALEAHFESLRLMCRIFFSLNYQDLPEFFEDHMKEWMTGFANYLQYENPLLTDADEEQDPSPIDKLQAAIIENLALYASKDEEPFMAYLPNFTRLVWNRLVGVSMYPKHDMLATKAIKFLSSLVQKIMHKELFKDESTLREIVLKIVIPNLTFRQSDEERFEDDPREFIVTEVEGSDSESRRKCSLDLLNSMCRQFESQTTTICAEHVGQMLQEYATNPNQKWAAKDAAIHLMMGIAIKGESSRGVSEVNAGVNVMDFFQKQILPELQDTNHNDRPVVKASAIKFVSVFRKQFTRENHVQLIPLLIGHLPSPVVVVHTFAAYAIERILITKDGSTNIPVITNAELKIFIEPLFNALFAIVDNTTQNENDYVMKCVMRTLATAGEDVIPVTQVVITKLTAALGRVAKNPRNPQFNHCLFESIAVLVRSVCSKDPNATTTMEPLLFEPFNTILQLDIMEFTPYVFQILAQLLEYRPAGMGLGQAYSGLFQPLLNPSIWEKRGNVPALARLMQAYIRKGANELVPQLQPILGVFQKLVASKATEVSSFEILNAAIVHFPNENMEPMVPEIFKLLLVRLQTANTPRYTRQVTTFFALFAGKYGPQAYFDRMNGFQQGLGTMLLEQVWAPRLKTDTPVQKVEAKIHVVGLSQLLCENQTILADASGQKAWVDTVIGVVKILTSSTFQTAVKPADDHDLEMEVGYDAKFSRLVYAIREVEDPFPDVADPTATFVQSLHGLLHRVQACRTLLQQGLGDDTKLATGLQNLFQQAGLQMG